MASGGLAAAQAEAAAWLASASAREPALSGELGEAGDGTFSVVISRAGAAPVALLLHVPADYSQSPASGRVALSSSSDEGWVQAVCGQVASATCGQSVGQVLDAIERGCASAAGAAQSCKGEAAEAVDSMEDDTKGGDGGEAAGVDDDAEDADDDDDNDASDFSYGDDIYGGSDVEVDGDGDEDDADAAGAGAAMSASATVASGASGSGEHADWVAEHALFRRLREAEEASRASGASALPPSSRHVSSIFSSREAGQVLIQELKALREVAFSHGLVAEPVGDDVYQWVVKLRKFPPKSAVAKGLRRLVEDDRFGYDYVELQFSFAKGLHPFYPPSVQVVRPRLAGAAMWRVMNLAPLQLENWKPVRPNGMLDVVLAVRDSLAEWAQVDMDHPANSLDNTSGAFSELERLLATLLSVSQTRPRASTGVSAEEEASNRAAEAGRAAAAAAVAAAATPAAATDKPPVTPQAPARPSASGGAKYWAKGTGYSSQSDSGWDTKAFVAARAERDRQLMCCLRGLLAYLDPVTPGQDRTSTAAELGAKAVADKMGSDIEGAAKAAAIVAAESLDPFKVTPPPSTRWPGFGSDPERFAFRATADALAQLIRKRAARLPPSASPPSEALAANVEEQTAAAEAIKDVPAVRQQVLLEAGHVLAGSCFLPFLADALGNSTLMQLHHQQALVRVLLELLRRVAAFPALVGVLALPAKSEAGGDSLADILGRLAVQARVAGAENKGEYDQLFDIVETSRQLNEAIEAAKGEVDAMAAAEREAATAAGLGAADDAAAAAEAPKPVAGAAAAAGASAGETGEPGDASEEAYCDAMQGLRYGYLSSPSIPGYHYAAPAAAVRKSSRKRMRRVGLEHSALMESLPLSRSSTVFVRYPEARADTLRVLIIGPEDTPYSGGAFIFDVFFPNDYPEGPPKVNLQTTGGGTVRFNPNLYNCGKVCLSLLGTWSGSAGEAWDPSVSTLNQVLISIQALILVPDPYWNEPGFQKRMHTAEGKAAAFQYADQRRLHTIRLAMLEQLRCPPLGFEEVIKLHFALRGKALLKQCEDWAADSAKHGSTYASGIAAAAKEFKELLARKVKLRSR
ncbi:hypothetical protein FNF28_02429 [Cafeteria roenbergensis]|uniref:UBC core domain-containing protein n=1 Tax=Cafeteria roenbergensis TaxID=33653 RepID=A0A5A8DY28_CAFRO|nr:hypothetical protein FNF28_02429 [Cafeteria roenbergensis]